ncbi:MAG TPA: hypothetical protein VGI16_10045 [Candidatus Acidoferrum sp.]|jgi:hypothetical protein
MIEVQGMVADGQRMPKILELVFFMAGGVLMLAGLYTVHRARNQWESANGRAARKRFKMSPEIRLQTALYQMGWCVCWSVAFSEWWLRATYATLCLGIVMVQLYVYDRRVSETPAFDEESVLRIEQSRR